MLFAGSERGSKNNMTQFKLILNRKFYYSYQEEFSVEDLPLGFSIVEIVNVFTPSAQKIFKIIPFIRIYAARRIFGEILIQGGGGITEEKVQDLYMLFQRSRDHEKTWPLNAS